MIERATVVLRFGAEYSDNEASTVSDEIEQFLAEYFGDEIWLESFEAETTKDKDQ